MHVLILGCGRSGTSIFGELFDHLPMYQYYSEPDFALLKELDTSQSIAVKVPRESPGYPASPGLSFPLDQLDQMLPGPKQIFWQVRHPLDTIASLKVGISRNWGHHPRPPDWQDWLEAPLVVRCAHHWNYINSIGYRQVAEQARLNRFEAMLIDPMGLAKSVCDTLQIKRGTSTAELEAWAGRVQNTNNEQFVEAITSRPYSTRDHSVRIGRWKENLSKEEVESVLPMISTTAANLGYDLG